MTVSVVLAFRHSGGLNAGTPFETASTPGDRAAAVGERPHEKEGAERLRPHDRRRDTGHVGRSPSTCPDSPIPISPSVVTRNTYVGIAKIVPLSRMPRMLMSMTNAIADDAQRHDPGVEPPRERGCDRGDARGDADARP